MPGKGRGLFFIIFTASGFAGLIYESIWTQYLKLFLGHAAYAQTLVLAVFMGGMALGSWLCARYSKRWGNLLLGYALVESIVGVCALLFHPIYVHFLDLAYTRLIPGLGSPALVSVFKWTTASLFILPQSILLGMTFPLMAGGVLRRFPQKAGATVAMLYFTNSIGAAVGVLAGGFLFIAWCGLPGTLGIAGVINIAVAAIVWRNVREDAPRAEKPGTTTGRGTNDGATFPYRVLLGVALLTGASSFIYEIGWIRMLNLVLGSSTHAFELMLCAFISGLALGGLWIRRRIDGLQQPVQFLAFVQIAMGGLALATLPLYGHTFDAMAWLIGNLERTAWGYALFNLASNSIALFIMLPATFCAGMTLPLITAIMLRGGQGEKSIGAVYAFNTIGCILGIFIAVHAAMPMLGLKGMVGLGAGIDIALGLALAWQAFPTSRVPALATAAGLAVFLIAMSGVTFEQDKMASGVYRSGVLLNPYGNEILYHHDGKTATVSVAKIGNILSIRTNGKSDASISLSAENNAFDDESTQIMLGTMPLLLHPRAKTAAVIGWGSGMSTAILLKTPQLERVDSVEIEPAMIQASELFRPRVDRAYTDPRSHIHIEDAKTFFSLYNRKYDIIVSEPSNPWVSGVAGLFSEEFYRRIKDHLSDDGLLVQWLQLYEIDMPLVASVFDALSSQFSDYVVYVTDDSDVIILARPAGAVPEPDPAAVSAQGLSDELNRVGINGLQDVLVRRLGNKRALQPLFDSYHMPSNSDYYPLLDLYAARALFMRTSVVKDLTNNPDLQLLPAVEMLGHEPAPLNGADISNTNLYKSIKIRLATALAGYIQDGRRWQLDLPGEGSAGELRQYADKVRMEVSSCSGKQSPDEWWDGTFYIMAQCILPYSFPHQLSRFWQKAEVSSCRSRMSPSQRDFIMLLKAVDGRDAPLMAQTARKLLEEMPTVHPVLQEYILAAGMLGELARGEKQAADALWKQYKNRLNAGTSQTLLMRMLVAHAEKAA